MSTCYFFFLNLESDLVRTQTVFLIIQHFTLDAVKLLKSGKPKSKYVL